MNIRKTRMLTFALAVGLSGAAQGALHDRGGGLIYDDVLNVTWLQDANYGAGSIYDNSTDSTDGRMTWENAVAWADTLSYYDSIRNVIYNDWRLPGLKPVDGVSFNYTYMANGATDKGYNLSAPGTVYAGSTASELAYMYYVNLGNPGLFTPAGGISSCYVNGSANCLDNTGPFINVNTLKYWSGTAYGLNDTSAWTFMMSDGHQDDSSMSDGSYAWAVRDGDVASVPEAETWVMLLAGLGLVGAMAQCRKQSEA